MTTTIAKRRPARIAVAMEKLLVLLAMGMGIQVLLILVQVSNIGRLLDVLHVVVAGINWILLMVL